MCKQGGCFFRVTITSFSRFEDCGFLTGVAPCSESVPHSLPIRLFFADVKRQPGFPSFRHRNTPSGGIANPDNAGGNAWGASARFADNR